MPGRVHVAFGFHVNCYHSYRGDSNDALGFGGDIRIIRHILDTLDERNARGIPVRGTWDFENAFSLESVLPRYAPDIIERVRRRQAENGDENLLMGYANGAMSAMTEDEFMASVEWAVSNPRGSGLRDLFSGCERIIRPQEIMFKPRDAALYRRAGVEAVCMYYSCISFDAFRTLIPPLPDGDAFNPLRYRWGGESITVIPTYSPNDVMDAGSLRALAVDLHDQQRRGLIEGDVLIFLNTDADSFLWEPMAVPAPLRKLPCFGGIGGYIDEAASLPFVVFDTPGGYLKSHPPVREISFGEDLADGNLSGYMSWSEKPFNRLIWTRLERARAIAALGRDRESPSFENRVRLLSTTHFGLASPVMNVVREEKARALSAEALAQERAALGLRRTLTVPDRSGSGLVAVQLGLDAGFVRSPSQLRLKAEGLKSWTACEMGRHADGSLSSLYLVALFDPPRAEYALSFTRIEARPSRRSGRVLGAGRLSLDLGALVPSLKKDGRTLAELQSWLDYDGRRVPFERGELQPLELAGEGEGLRLRGGISLPGQLEPGGYCFDFFTLPGLDCLFCRTELQWPYTREDHEISSQASNLGRYSDTKWKQTAPFTWTLRLSDRARVLKRDFTGSLSHYDMADFWNAYPENENICAINHQLTGGILGLGDENGGLLMVNARQVLGSMAHCPLRLETRDGRRVVTLNPFGTYFGPQRHYPSRGNGSSMELYLAAAPQARSLGPAYNGAWEQGIHAFFLTDAPEPGAETLRLAAAIADGAPVPEAEEGAVHPFTGDNVRLHEAVGNKLDPKELKSVTFVEQLGGAAPLLDLVRRYTENLLRAQRKMRKTEKSWES